MEKKTALITGASSGIGKELAKLFAKDGYNLVFVSRNQQILQEISDDLKNKYGVEVHVIASDLSKYNAASAIIDNLKLNNISVDVLVNNAGIGYIGNFSSAVESQQMDTLFVNITALTQLTHLLLPQMLQKDSAMIVNISSTAAFVPGPNFAVYHASKAYVSLFSLALSEELKGTSVSVTTVYPGVTRTNFFKHENLPPSNIFLLKLFPSMDAETVAKISYNAMLKKKRQVTCGLFNKIAVFIFKITPEFIKLLVAKKILS